MTSSTSHFKPPRRPILAVAVVLGVAVLAWVFGAVYSLYFNPQVRAVRALCEAKLKWSDKLRASQPSQFILCGGSSSSYSIDPAWALEHGNLAIANLAVRADIGAVALSRFALQKARKGDTLLVTFEPNTAEFSFDPPQFAVQVAYSMGSPGWAWHGIDFTERRTPWLRAFSALRPGADHIFVLLRRRLSGLTLYRYEKDPILETGQAITSLPFDPIKTAFPPAKIPDEARQVLTALSSHCRSNEIKIAYLMPWQYVPLDEAPKLAAANQTFLKEMREIMPVVDEPGHGVVTNRAWVADIPWHLNREGSRARTESLIEALKKFQAP